MHKSACYIRSFVKTSNYIYIYIPQIMFRSKYNNQGLYIFGKTIMNKNYPCGLFFLYLNTVFWPPQNTKCILALWHWWCLFEILTCHEYEETLVDFTHTNITSYIILLEIRREEKEEVTTHQQYFILIHHGCGVFVTKLD